MRKPTKAIIAAAGFGTRFLPQTKAMPKEMLPLIDKPIIQYVVEELVEAGIKDIIIIGSANKRAIEDHLMSRMKSFWLICALAVLKSNRSLTRCKIWLRWQTLFIFARRARTATQRLWLVLRI